MEANYFKFLGETIVGEKCFIIPVYQRPYTWSEENCIRLIEDALKNKGEKYFIGSVVLNEKGILPNESNITGFEVVDGQQRLTTTMLILRALSTFDKKLYKWCERFLYNLDCPIQSSIYENKLLNEVDRSDIYKKIMNEELDVGQYSDGSIMFRNYKAIYTYLKNYSANDNLENIFIAISKLHIVSIKLHTEDDAQVIFETLNSTGKPLKKYELIKNYLMLKQKDTEAQKECYFKFIKPLEDIVPDNGRDDFIRSYLILKDEREIKKGELYEVFKRLFDFSDVDTYQISKELYEMATYYACIKAYDGAVYKTNKLRRILLDLNKLKYPNIIAPTIMFLLASEDNGSLEMSPVCNILEFITTFLLRRKICNYPSNALTKIFYPMARRFNERKNIEGITAEENINGLLQARGQYPSDSEFQVSLTKIDVYTQTMRSALKIFLSAYNRSINPKEELDSDDATIEHIAPQTLTGEWVSELGNDFRELTEGEQDRAINSLGNMTLTKYNQELGNMSFRRKKEHPSYTESNYPITREIASMPTFSLSDLRRRGERLAKSISELCSLPKITNDKFLFISKENKVEVNKEYDLLDKEFLPTSKTITSFTVYDAVLETKEKREVRSWREFYNCLLNYLYDSDRDNMLEIARQDDIFLELENNLNAYDICDKHEIYATSTSYGADSIVSRMRKLLGSYYENIIVTVSVKF